MPYSASQSSFAAGAAGPGPFRSKRVKGNPLARTLGPVSDLEKHLPGEWWKTLFNSFYLKTDGDVVENESNTRKDIDFVVEFAQLRPEDSVLDLCCGQGRHTLELASRGFSHLTGIDRSRYLIRLARKRARQQGVHIQFSEGDARKVRLPERSLDCVLLMGNSFGYFEREADDVAVLESVKRVLKSEGKLVLDIVDGGWMKSHFEPRSWEWIDQNHMVCRERSLSSDGKRIISREVIVHAEMGVLADQFYAERLYTAAEIQTILERLGFRNLNVHANVISESTRGQDLGMMANRLFVFAQGPVKRPVKKSAVGVREVTVIMGDPHLPDTVKKGGRFNLEDFDTIQRLKQALGELKSFKFTYLNQHASLLKELMAHPPKFVFNLCDEGFDNDATKELHVPAVLELLKVPYTGAGPACLGMCYNKSLVRAIVADLDVPVPLETFFHPTDQSATIPSIFPALLKPNFGDSSIGITQQAVVHSSEELINYLDQLKMSLPGVPVLIQEFLSGTEYSVGIVGNPGRYEVLPILEVDFQGLPPDLPKILPYESKWDPQSPYWNAIRYVPARLDEDSKRALVDGSLQLFEKLGCRDYARFDFRADAAGKIKFLEANPNPGWCWDGKLNLMAELEGISYSALLEKIIVAGMERAENGCLPPSS